MTDEDSLAIGIHLGTSFSCVAVLQHGEVNIIPNEKGKRITPSCIVFTDTERHIGEAANNILNVKPTSNTVVEAKHLLGRRFDDPVVHACMKNWPTQLINHQGKPKIQVEYRKEKRTFFPEELCAMILLKLKESAEAYLGKAISKAVISVPAHFNDSQRWATKDAGTIAGLNILKVINEPSAAAMAHILEKKYNAMKSILVYYLGSRSFQVSVLHVLGGSCLVKSFSEDTNVGGQFFTDRMVNHFIEEFKKDHGKDLSTDKIALFRLRTACESAKLSLTSTSEAVISLDSLFEGIDFQSSITRAKFEELNEDLIWPTLNLVQNALRDAGWEKKDIQEIVLAGGSTRIPRIRQLLKRFFLGKELNNLIEPEEAVAYGAAIHAALLNFSMPKELMGVGIRLSDLAHYSLGVSLGEILHTMIFRRDVISADATVSISTTTDNQHSIEFKIYEGENVRAKDNKLIGMITMNGLRPAPRGQTRVTLTFKVESDGILSATSAAERCPVVQSSTIVTMEETRLTNVEIAQLSKVAERMRIEDIETRELAEAKSSLISRSRAYKSLLAKIVKEKSTASKLCEDSIQWCGKDPIAKKEDVKRKTEELDQYFSELLGHQHLQNPSPSGSGSSREDSLPKRPRTRSSTASLN